ncbi:MAG: ATP-binding cassette domain-containing protein, partial [Leptolyngbyaceae bacterium]|nr:ATP-binding cassette domain-containing protein [Leptolyngbyaceae bacterium]
MTHSESATATLNPPTHQTLLHITGLNVYYGESHILRDVDLSVPTGKMVCLIGRNGVGKTTMLKTIMGLLQARRGIIEYDGKPINSRTTDQRARMGIGYVPQGREI